MRRFLRYRTECGIPQVGRPAHPTEPVGMPEIGCSSIPVEVDCLVAALLQIDEPADWTSALAEWPT